MRRRERETDPAARRRESNARDLRQVNPRVSLTQRNKGDDAAHLDKCGTRRP